MINSNNAATDLKMPAVALSPEQWKIVAQILRQHLPGREVWAYGSRARGAGVKRFSDLDLAVDGAPLSLEQRSRLSEAFDESPLPFKVDLTETETLDPGFRMRIEADKVVLAFPE